MVSGFLTSPCDHCRMSSAVASPMRNSSKKLTSSTYVFLTLQLCCQLNHVGPGGGVGHPSPKPRTSHFFYGARLATRKVNAQLFSGPEHFVVRLAHLQGHAVAGQH